MPRLTQQETALGEPEAGPRADVVVAMLTYQRPGGLARALPPLVAQVLALELRRARLVIVDNDPAATARAVVEEFSASGVTYVHEPRPGIAAGRNAALGAATDARAIVFNDVDEVPTEGWLDHLVGAWQRWGCAGVAGPTLRVFEDAEPAWVRSSRFFARTRRATGSRVMGAATNNLLLDLGVLRQEHLAFDERFGITGGSDTMISRSLSRAGHQILWCDEAEVLDVVPTARATREWVLRRSFRTGTTWSRVHLALHERSTMPRVLVAVRQVAERLELTLRGVVRVAVSGATVVAGRIGAGRERVPAAECAVASAAGMIAGAWGVEYREYLRGAR